MRPFGRLVLLAGAGAIALAIAIRLGAVPLSAREIVLAARGLGDPSAVAIIRDLRLPRAVLAALVGAALASSGATFQALLRNPLAEPYILGVSGGAAVGAVLAIVLGLAAAGALPIAAFAGALVAVALVLRIAISVGRALDTQVVLLAGVVVGALFNACILLALTFADAQSFRSAIFWMMGSLSGATWRGSGVLVLYLAPGLALLLALARPLNLLAIGEETAAHLGVSVERTKYLALGAASLLTAAAVAVSGAIGFVGLIVPHIIRLRWGNDHRFLIPASALLGAAFLVLADALARTVAAPNEIPVGVVTAFVGVPFFIWLLRSSRPGAKDASGRADRPGSVATPEDASAARGSVGADGTEEWGRGGGRRESAAWKCGGLSFTYPGANRQALNGISLEITATGCTALLGPNGSGKSTFLKLLLKIIRPEAGTVEFRGQRLGRWERAEFARTVGVVPQGEEISFPLTVRELVAMGRYPHLGAWRPEGRLDRLAIERAMRRCDVLALAARPFSTLSGGERQRARVARALAQEPRVLALDEPTAALDIRHEMSIFELLRELSRAGVTVLLATHNVNLAARYADRLILLREGRVAAEGPPRAVIRRELIEEVYGWPVRVSPLPGLGPNAAAPQVIPLAMDTPRETHPSPELGRGAARVSEPG